MGRVQARVAEKSMQFAKPPVRSTTRPYPPTAVGADLCKCGKVRRLPSAATDLWVFESATARWCASQILLERGHSCPIPLGFDPPHPGGMADNSPYGEFPIRALEFGHSARLKGSQSRRDCISQSRANPEGISSFSPPTLKGLHRLPSHHQIRVAFDKNVRAPITQGGGFGKI